jgi:hypothetical protein
MCELHGASSVGWVTYECLYFSEFILRTTVVDDVIVDSIDHTYGGTNTQCLSLHVRN